MKIEMLGGQRSQLVWKRKASGKAITHGMNSVLVIVAFEEMVIHTVGNIQHVARKVSLGLGRAANKELGIKVVVAEVIEEDKT